MMQSKCALRKCRSLPSACSAPCAGRKTGRWGVIDEAKPPADDPIQTQRPECNHRDRHTRDVARGFAARLQPFLRTRELRARTLRVLQRNREWNPGQRVAVLGGF